MREKDSAIPRSERISHVLAHIMTPAPISLNWLAASYTSTLMSGYLESATANVRPPIPPPLQQISASTVWKKETTAANIPDRNTEFRRHGPT